MSSRTSMFVSSLTGLLAAGFLIGSCSSSEPTSNASEDLAVPMVTVGSLGTEEDDVTDSEDDQNSESIGIGAGATDLDESPVSDAVDELDSDEGLDSDEVSAAPDTTYGEDIGLACANVEIGLIRVLDDPTQTTVAANHASEAIARVKTSTDDRFIDLVADLAGDPAGAEWQQAARTFLDACEAAGYEVL